MQAGDAGASTPLASVALEVSDATFEVTGCATPKVITVVSAASPDVSWQVQLYARLVGTAPTRSEFLFGDGNARVEGNFLICEGAGDWIVSGTLTSQDYVQDLEFKVALESSFKISKAVTKTNLTRV